MGISGEVLRGIVESYSTPRSLKDAGDSTDKNNRGPGWPQKSKRLNTVVVCDTEPIAIEGLRALLESADELRVDAAETSLVNGMNAVRTLAPSLLMLDKAFGIHGVIDLLR